MPQQFPREVQTYRKKVFSETSYLNFLGENYQRVDCYTSLYAAQQIDKGIIDTVFAEIDAKDMQEAAMLAKIFEKELKGRKLKFRKYFTGGRGFHYYLDIEPVILENPAAVVRRFFSNFPKVFDPHTIGNVRQLVRIPYTVHHKTGLYAVRVDPWFSIADAISPLKREETFEINGDLSGILADVSLILKERRAAEVEALPMGDFPACIIEALHQLRTSGHLSHPGRLHLTAFMNKLGASKESIISIFKYAKDFNLRKTSYQVGKIMRQNFNCYGCRRAKEVRMCPLSGPAVYRCPFFPSINRRL